MEAGLGRGWLWLNIWNIHSYTSFSVIIKAVMEVRKAIPGWHDQLRHRWLSFSCWILITNGNGTRLVEIINIGTAIKHSMLESKFMVRCFGTVQFIHLVYMVSARLVQEWFPPVSGDINLQEKKIFFWSAKMKFENIEIIALKSQNAFHKCISKS